MTRIFLGTYLCFGGGEGGLTAALTTAAGGGIFVPGPAVPRDAGAGTSCVSGILLSFQIVEWREHHCPRRNSSSHYSFFSSSLRVSKSNGVVDASL